MSADTHGYSQTMRVLLTQFNDETLIASSSTLLIVLVLFVGYWVYNRKRFHQLGHQIPATVVKNYLDSIIQNSASLKSALFRGGGLDVAPGSIPSVLPLHGMPVGEGVGLASNSEELNQKNAQISSLTARLNEKTSQVGQLEGQLAELNQKLKAASSSTGTDNSGASAEEVAGLQAKIKDLEAKLAEALKGAQAAPAAGGDSELQAQLEKVTQERDQLKERLAEYEIIEDDLANLKRLQQENEQLKKSLGSLGGGAAAVAAGAAVSASAASQDNEASEEAPSAASTAVEEPEQAGGGKNTQADLAEASGGDSGGGDTGTPNLDNAESKSAEDLLNEFEKMLGS